MIRVPVHHLPAIDNAWHRLPLADSTLLRLADALLADDDQRGGEFQQTLLDDPALALWCVSWAWAREQRSLTTASDAAQWLKVQGLAAVADKAEDATPDGIDWSDCVAQSMARRKAALAAEASIDDQFVALLSNVAQWRRMLRAVQEISADTIGPAWLTELKSVDDETVVATEVEDSLAIWQCEHPVAWSLFQRAMTMRNKFDDFQQHWDEEFLREKLASLKEFTYGASHELNNPLFNISSRAQILLRDEEDPERRRKLSTIYAHAIRASEMINEIALAARLPPPEHVSVDLTSVVGDVVAELQPAAEEQATQLTFDDPTDPATVEADTTQLAVAVREIIINALESLKRSTRRGEITVTVNTSGDGNREITIADNGPGMDDRAKRHLFDPFFSGYESGRGLGFGLTKCWQIVEAHHGTIVVDSQPGRGTTFTVRLPATQGAPTGQAVEELNADSGS